MQTINLTTTLSVETCCACGITFAMPTDYQINRRNDHKTFYCPTGHSQSYFAESVEEKYRRLYAQEQQAHDQAEARARDAEEAAGKLAAQAKRLRKRAANGVCPCCKRTFAELSKHMRSKHPDYATA